MARKERSERKIVALCARLKAAPEFEVNCNCKKEPTISFGFDESVRSASDLLAESKTTTASAIIRSPLIAL